MITWKKGKREEMRKEERGKNTRHLSRVTTPPEI